MPTNREPTPRSKGLCRQLRDLRAAWWDRPSIAPHMDTAPGYTTGTAVRLCGEAAREITRLRAEVRRLGGKP